MTNRKYFFFILHISEPNPVRAGCEKGRSLVYCEKSQGDTVKHIYCHGQLMPAKCSGQSLLWPYRREKK